MKLIFPAHLIKQNLIKIEINNDDLHLSLCQDLKIFFNSSELHTDYIPAFVGTARTVKVMKQ